MLFEERNRVAQLCAPEHVHVVVPPLVGIGAEDSAAEGPLHDLEDMHVSPVRAKLKRGLVTMAGEDALPGNQADGKSELEFAHFSLYDSFHKGTRACAT